MDIKDLEASIVRSIKASTKEVFSTMLMLDVNADESFIMDENIQKEEGQGQSLESLKAAPAPTANTAPVVSARVIGPVILHEYARTPATLFEADGFPQPQEDRGYAAEYSRKNRRASAAVRFRRHSRRQLLAAFRNRTMDKCRF